MNKKIIKEMTVRPQKEIIKRIREKVFDYREKISEDENYLNDLMAEITTIIKEYVPSNSDNRNIWKE